MFGSRARSAVTVAVILEVGIAGWYRGEGALWLAAMLAAVTLFDCALGVVRRRSYADIVGLELGAVLIAMLLRSNDVLLTTAIAAACAAWLIRPERVRPDYRPSHAMGLASLSSAAAARTDCCQSPLRSRHA